MELCNALCRQSRSAAAVSSRQAAHSTHNKHTYASDKHLHTYTPHNVPKQQQQQHNMTVRIFLDWCASVHDENATALCFSDGGALRELTWTISIMTERTLHTPREWLCRVSLVDGVDWNCANGVWCAGPSSSCFSNHTQPYFCSMLCTLEQPLSDETENHVSNAK